MRQIILGIVKDAKGLFGKEFSHRTGHAGEIMDGKVDRVLTENVESRAGTFDSVLPGVMVVEPILLHW